jgi:hypothetical protein
MTEFDPPKPKACLTSPAYLNVETVRRNAAHKALGYLSQKELP